MLLLAVLHDMRQLQGPSLEGLFHIGRDVEKDTVAFLRVDLTINSAELDEAVLSSWF